MRAIDKKDAEELEKRFDENDVTLVANERIFVLERKVRRLQKFVEEYNANEERKSRLRALGV